MARDLRLDIEIRQTGNEVSQLKEDIRLLEHYSDRWRTELRRLDDEMRYSAELMYRMARNAEELIEALDRLEMATRGARDDTEQLGDDARESAEDMNRLEGTIEDARRDLEHYTEAARQANQETDLMGDIFIGAARAIGERLLDMLGEAAQAVWEFTKESITAFEEFDNKQREIFTLRPGLDPLAKYTLTKEVTDLSIELARPAEDIQTALYQAISLGIPDEDAIEAVRLAGMAARAGMVDVNDALTTGQSIINAYGPDVLSLAEAYDLMFYGVKNGALTFTDLASGLSEVTSVAGEVGVNLEDIMAALIVMTKQGDSFGEAKELLSLLLTQLQIPSTPVGEAFFTANGGKTFKQFIQEGGTLAEAVKMIRDLALETNQELVVMLGGSPFYYDKQALRGVQELINVMEDFELQTIGAYNATGLLSEAMQEVAGSAQMMQQQSQAAWEAMMVSWGRYLEPLTGRFYQEKEEFAIRVMKGLEANVAVREVGDIVRETIDADAERQEAIIDAITAHGTRYGMDYSERQVNTAGDIFMRQAFAERLIKLNPEIDPEALRNELDFMQQEINGKLELGMAAATVSPQRKAFLLEMAKDYSRTLSSEEISTAMKRRLDEEDAFIDKLIQRQIIEDNARKLAIEAAEAEAAAAEAAAQAELDRMTVFEKAVPLMEAYMERLEVFTENFGEGLGFAREIGELETAIGNLSPDQFEKPEQYEKALSKLQEDLTEAKTDYTTTLRDYMFEYMLTTQGATEQTIALGVALGSLTPEEADFAEGYARATTALEQLAGNAGFALLSIEEKAIVTQSIIDGVYTSAQRAVDAFNFTTEWDKKLEEAATPAAEEFLDKIRQKFTQTGDTEQGSGFDIEIGIDYDQLSMDELQIRVDEFKESLKNGKFDADIDPFLTKVGQMEEEIAGVAKVHEIIFEVIVRGDEIPQPPDDEEYVPPPRGPNNSWSGGRADPYFPYLVGDGPGGRITPYTELFIPDQPGYIMNAGNTRQLISKMEALAAGGQGGGTAVQIEVINNFYGNVGQQEIIEQNTSSLRAALDKYFVK